MSRREVPGIGHNQPPGPLDETESVPELGGVKAGSKVMTIPEAGRELGYGRNRSYTMARTEEIPTVPNSGRKKMVPRAWVEAMLERTTEKALARSGLGSDTGQVKPVDPKAAEG
jgi:hypothetical protein